MTIDSVYTPGEYPAHTGVRYIFDIESFGAENIEVFRVTKAGVRTVLPADGWTYTLTFERNLSEVPSRGLVTLNQPLLEGDTLQVQRLTAVENTFLAVNDEPFPTESFELILDKICFIQQELEGHACDCRATF